MPTPRRDRISEPKLILLALGAAAVMVLLILAIIGTGDAWLAVVAAVAIALIGLGIVVELRGVMGDSGDAPEAAPPPPGRAVVVCTAALTAPQVLGALAATGSEHHSVLVVAPEGLSGHGLLGDEHDYARARQAETATVAALRRAGVNAAGQVGDRNPAHAIEDALALFPAPSVVVVAARAEMETYRRHLDGEALKRRTGAEVRVLEA